MAYLLASIPYFKCMVRKEYLRNFEDGHGEYCEATAVAVLSVRGDSLHLQTILHEPLAGCAFILPIEALVTKPASRAETKAIQPWDCFSSDIGVCEIATLRRGAVKLRDGSAGSYLFTIASTGSDLADDPAQRKLLHLVAMDNGLICAMPNNRMVFVDRALFGDLTTKPELKTLTREFRAEGSAPSGERRPAPAHLPGACHSDPAERPDWQQRLPN